MEDAAKFDVIVVGSGFGGSVMTHELVSRGLRVCLLERGKKYAPGEFARSPYQMSFNTWDPSEGLHGMFNLWRFRELDAIVASGLGGGSLVYANVLLRKPPEWFDEHWPIRRDELDPYYTKAEDLLGAQRYPVELASYNTRRSQVFFEAIERAAHNLNAPLTWEDLNLSVSVADRKGRTAPGILLDDGRGNLHGRPRVTCQLCGECNFGCNYGAKNTLDYTCLSGLPEDKVTILTRCEVRSIEPRYDDGDKDRVRAYRVTYVDHSQATDGERRATYDRAELEPKPIEAPQLVLAAGSLGTTFLLLRSQGAFPELSHTLGSRFSSNGDLLMLANRRRQGLNGANAPRLVDGSAGPVITRCATFLQGLPRASGGRSDRGFYIQDAGFPNAANWVVHLWIGNIIQAMLENGSELLRGVVERYTQGERTDVSAQVAHLMRLISEEEWVPLLGIGQDTPDGQITFDEKTGKAQVTWRAERSEAYYSDLRKVMEAIVEAMGAKEVRLPWQLSRPVTVHPLGGCPMGRNPDEGVVDAFGRVFRGDADRVYDGLFIADGSIMPGPVGANPSLTIAAMALRIAEKVAENHASSRIAALGAAVA